MELLRETSDEIVAAWGPVLFRVVSGAATDAAVIDYVAERFDEMLEDYAAVGGLVIIEHGTPFPTVEALRYARERFDGYRNRLVTVYSILGLGFWATTAIRRGTALVGASSHTAKLETSLERACEQLSRELVGINTSELHNRAEQLREMLRVRQAGATTRARV